MTTSTDPSTRPGLLARLREHWLIATVGGGVVVAAVAWLAFGYFGIHTLFFDDEVNEATPVFDSGAGASGLPSDAMTDDEAAAMNDAMADEGTPLEAVADDPAPMTDGPDVVTLVEGQFIDRSHPTEGRALVLNDGTTQRFLRFEDFRTDNGPDLNVYLSTAPPDAPAGDFDRPGGFVDLGDLSGNVGPQNYEIPEDVDLDEFTTVVIWCVRFGVAFGAAELG